MADEDKRLPFHRKYRPNTLTRYVGNEKMKVAALSALAKEVRPQVILLEGASGCGKTTFARLLAKEYMCDSRDKTMGACNTCYSCTSLDEFILTGDTSMLANVREIDIADQSGKRDIDGVIEEMAIPSYGDEWKVFIFDECHMATPQAQNRMLKVAEEPPENVLMIFCTTDPEKMLETLVNRCQIRLHVKKPSVGDLAGLLKYVCNCEGVGYDTKGLNFIANRSGLTIREALTNLDRVISEQEKATYTCAIEVFEQVADTIIINFFNLLLPEEGKKRDVMGFVVLLHSIKAQTELKSFVTSLLEFTRRGIYTINQIQLDGVSDGELKVYRDIFSRFTVEQLARLLIKLNDLQFGDIESKLLLLGYAGIKDDYEVPRSSVKDLGIVDTQIDKPIAELSAESKQATISHKSIENERLANFEDKITEENSNVDSIDCLLDFFGGSIVKP